MVSYTDPSSRPRTLSYGSKIARGRSPLICWIGLSRRQSWAVVGPCSKQFSQVQDGACRRLWRHTSSLARDSSGVSASARPRAGAPALCFQCVAPCCWLAPPAASLSNNPPRPRPTLLRSWSCLLPPAPLLLYSLSRVAFLPFNDVIVTRSLCPCTSPPRSFLHDLFSTSLYRLGCHLATVCSSHTRLSRV